MRKTVIRGVLFDFDGTLTQPGALDFEYLREELGCPPGAAILEHLDSLPPGPVRDEKLAFLDRYERQAAARSQPNPGAERTVSRLLEMGFEVGVFTRNSAAAVEQALKSFKTYTRRDAFAVFLTRDDDGPLKPDPDSVPHAAQLLGVDPSEIMVVGDHRYDIEAGHSAGSWTCLLRGHPQLGAGDPGTGAEYEIDQLDELPGILELHRPLAVGKLPAEHLAPLLAEMRAAGPDAAVVIGPRIGEDTAVVQTGGDDLVVLKTDPITFATDEIGLYAVHVSANDLVCSGAEPRWFLATVLFPADSTLRDARMVVKQITTACDQLGIAVVGGHTEITEAVRQPVVSGTMAGSVQRASLVDKRDISPGDILVLTKSAGLEGTAILCTELADRLRAAGISAAEIEEGCGFVQRLSVVRDAMVASGIAGLHGMHDVTEGGVMTALQELAQAGEVSLTIELDAIPTAAVTRRVCEALRIDALGLIGSGALLLAVAQESRETLLQELHAHEIPAAVIGRADHGAPGVIRATRGGTETAPPRFEVDEIARLFAAE